MPNRIIKESICTSEDINKLSKDAEILFYRLIVKADDYGAYFGDERIVKSACFPLKSDDIKNDQVKSWLLELGNAGLIHIYEAQDGRTYLQFTKWEKHQQVRAKKRKFPAFDDTCKNLISNDSKCPRNPIQSNPIRNQHDTHAREDDEDGNGDGEDKREDDQDEEDDLFDDFWNAYPKKTGDIKSAYFEYLGAIKTTAPEILIGAVKQQSKDMTREDCRYFPSAEKWLRNKGWMAKSDFKEPEKKPKPQQDEHIPAFTPPEKRHKPYNLADMVEWPTGSNNYIPKSEAIKLGY